MHGQLSTLCSRLAFIKHFPQGSGPPRDGRVNPEEVWPTGSGSVCASRDNSLSAVVLLHASSPTGMAEAACWNKSTAGSPVLADPSLVFRYHSTTRRSP